MPAMPLKGMPEKHRGHGPLLQVATFAASMAKISPAILTGPSRKVATRLSTVSCTRHPHPLWRTPRPAMDVPGPESITPPEGGVMDIVVKR